MAERVELHTGDLRELPFADAGFDVVISNLAVHNIPTVAGRPAAVDEAVRVLLPNGKPAIVDPLSGRYAARLCAAGLTGVRRRNVGWRMWCGSPLLPSHLVTGTKTG